jgi:uroporphyrinogen-III synthase
MNGPCQLHNQGVLVTRPASQSANLCALIKAAGGTPIAFPTLEIRALNDGNTHRRLEEPWDLMLFVSRNAVEFGLEQMRRPPTTPSGTGHPRIGAVGRATAMALKAHDLAPDLLPEQGFDSEALLALPALKTVAGRRVLIVRGLGGRPLLGETLIQRGAEVAYAEVYERVVPDADINALIPHWQQELRFITATSDEVLQNLCEMVNRDHLPWLRRIPLVVMSDRGGGTAMQLGFRTVAVAEEASDEGIVEALCRLAINQRPSSPAVRR